MMGKYCQFVTLQSISYLFDFSKRQKILNFSFQITNKHLKTMVELVLRIEARNKKIKIESNRMYTT